ncbi:MAG TPA: DUF642 domain-containing protein [Bryobacteraceae bacterium]
MLVHRVVVYVLVAAALLIPFSVPAYADLIGNGSFEQGTFVNDGNGTMTFSAGPTSITGWTAVGRQVSWIESPNPWGLSAQDGNFFLDLTAYNPGAPFGGVTQDITTVVGQQYDLSFYLGSYTRRWGGPPVSILASAGGTSQTFSVSTTSTASTWTPFSLLFTATSTTTTVTLTGAAGLNYIGLDHVMVNPSGTPAVPEPGSYALIALGTALLAVVGRRTRRSCTSSKRASDG